MNKISNIQKLGLEIKFSATALYIDIKIAVSHTRQQDKWHGKTAFNDSQCCYGNGKGADIKVYVQSSKKTTDICVNE